MHNESSLFAEIARARRASAVLETTGDAFRAWCSQAVDLLAPLLDETGNAPAYPQHAKVPLARLLEDKTFAATPVADLILQQIRGGIETTSGGFMGYIPGGGLAAGAIGDLVTAVTNRYAGYQFCGPGAADTENEIIRWLCARFGYDERAWGCLTSGGTIAALTCLAAARHRVDHVERSNLVIYLTDQAHHANTRSLKILGLDHARLSVVATDEAQRMNVRELERLIREDLAQDYQPFLVIANAGTTNTGAIDPLPQIADLAAAFGLWLHVDAAYGGFFTLTPAGRKLLAGMERADSIVVDPHKGMFLSYGTGAALVRDGMGLKLALQEDAPYLNHEDDPNPSPADYSLELTRHHRAPRMALSLALYGEAAFVAALEEKLLLARWLYESLRECAAISVLGEPQLSIVAFRAADDQKTQELLRHINGDGALALSATTLAGVRWIRACILSFRTHQEHVARLVAKVRAFAGMP